MNDDFVPAPYVTAPLINVASGIALGNSLLQHTPASLGPAAQAATARLRDATQHMEEIWAKRAPPTVRDARPLDNSADVAWAAFIDRIAAYASLPQARHPKAEQAAGVLTRLELRDRGWLNARFNEQWAQAQRRLDRIESLGLRATVQTLAGEDFLTEVEQTHKAYGEALGITAQHPEVEANVDLVEPLRALGAAMAAYGLQLAAQYAGADAEGRRAIVRALRPIDEHRVRYARGGQPDAQAPTPPPPPSDPA